MSEVRDESQSALLLLNDLFITLWDENWIRVHIFTQNIRNWENVKQLIACNEYWFCCSCYRLETENCNNRHNIEYEEKSKYHSLRLNIRLYFLIFCSFPVCPFISDLILFFESLFLNLMYESIGFWSEYREH